MTQFDHISMFRHFTALLRAHDRQHDHERDALKLALAAMDARLAGMNEFRAQSADQANRFLTIAAFTAYKEGAEQRQRWLIGTLLSAVTLAASIIIALLATG